ncbi:MAG TPA: protein translocase subunit SecF [Clostridiales bacterium]|nr:protein translocase subunit SecF [Clostridiales bacterium]HQP70054.1 protein translocase subunit SecF [Clostridiales bacterium]
MKIKTTNFNFMRVKVQAMLISATIILIGLLSIVFQGGLDYNIEFNGGYLMQAAFKDKVDISEIRSTFSSQDFPEMEIQEFSDQNSDKYGTEVVLKVESSQQDIKVLEERITEVLNSKFGEESYEVRQSTSIGPKVGDELKSSTLQAVLWTVLLILIYITIKFQFRFAVGAVVALVHDILITIGILSILGYFFGFEISLSVIAALLTILGYSLNDTIVVYDRIREDMTKYQGMEFEKLINTSINETLVRTLLTGACTLFVVIILIIFGGEVIRQLTITLLIGIITGTYSSLYVAAPVVLYWEQLTHKKRHLKKA